MGTLFGPIMYENAYFKDHELACSCCGKNHFQHSTLQRLISTRIRYEQLLREAGVKSGFGLVVNSGYRCPDHNEAKGYTQTHATGQAVDLRVAYNRAHYLLQAAFEKGWSGIGVNQKGAGGSRFIHLDDMPAVEGQIIRPTVWSY